MDDRQRSFLTNLIHQVINSGIHSLIWRLPTPVLVLVLGGAIAVVWFFQLY